MKKRNRITVALVVLVVAASLFVALFLLVRGGRVLGGAQDELRLATEEYQALFGMDPFPSRENVALERANRETLDRWFGQILSAVSHPPLPAERSPSTFVRLLAEKRDLLLESARRCRVRDVPSQDRFSLSFERYLGGSMLPAPDDVPELTSQLLVVDGLCRLLFESGILSLVSVTRDEFESAGKTQGQAPAEPSRIIRSAGGSAPSAGRAGEANRAAPLVVDPLYTRMTFGFKFTATEDVLWNVLNALAKHDVFAVVSLLSIEKTGSDVRQSLPEPGPAETAAQSEEAGAVSLKDLPRSARQASGTEMQAPLSVTMEVHAYLFRTGKAADGVNE
jgi:hypothetical protein